MKTCPHCKEVVNPEDLVEVDQDLLGSFLNMIDDTLSDKTEKFQPAAGVGRYPEVHEMDKHGNTRYLETCDIPDDE